MCYFCVSLLHLWICILCPQAVDQQQIQCSNSGRMQRRELPSGYIESISAHNNPLKAEPPPPIIQRKEAQTLMSHCLKEFIRERLYGKLVNYSRHQQQYHNKTSIDHPRSLLPNIKSAHTSTAPSILLTADVLRRQTTHRYSGYAKSNLSASGKEPIATNRNNRSSLSSLQHSLLQKSKINPHRASVPLTNLTHNQKSSPSRSPENSLNNSQEPYQISSFLSAVEDLGRHQRLVVRKEKKLSPLAASLDANEKLEKIKGNKKTVASDRLAIDINTWELFCRKDFLILNIQLTTDELTQANLLGKSTLTKGTMGPNGQKSKVFNTKSSFSRQNFLAYLNNTQLVAPLLPHQAFLFFQMNNKISDNMTVEDYKAAVEKLATAGPRLWSVLAFRFWDVDQNGLIDSNDIFEMYKKLDQTKVQLALKAEDKSSRGLAMVSTLLKELQNLRQKINTLDLQRKLANSIQVAEPQNTQGIYLQESLIRRKELSYSQLELVLGQNLKQGGKNQKHSVIESAAELGIKFSSCYRYSFMATDHNQQTRENREYIQRMREGLKKEKDTTNRYKEMLIQQPLPAINYSTFVASSYFAAIKELVLQVFAMQVQAK